MIGAARWSDEASNPVVTFLFDSDSIADARLFAKSHALYFGVPEQSLDCNRSNRNVLTDATVDSEFVCFANMALVSAPKPKAPQH